MHHSCLLSVNPRFYLIKQISQFRAQNLLAVMHDLYVTINWSQYQLSLCPPFFLLQPGGIVTSYMKTKILTLTNNPFSHKNFTSFTLCVSQECLLLWRVQPPYMNGFHYFLRSIPRSDSNWRYKLLLHMLIIIRILITDFQMYNVSFTCFGNATSYRFFPSWRVMHEDAL